MRTSKFSEIQIVTILKQQEAGVKVADICRGTGSAKRRFYKWYSKYCGMEPSMLRRVKELEAENARLKKMYAESQMDQVILKEALGKKGYGPVTVERWRGGQPPAIAFRPVGPVSSARSARAATGIDHGVGPTTRS